MLLPPPPGFGGRPALLLLRQSFTTWPRDCPLLCLGPVAGRMALEKISHFTQVSSSIPSARLLQSSLAKCPLAALGGYLLVGMLVEWTSSSTGDLAGRAGRARGWPSGGVRGSPVPSCPGTPATHPISFVHLLAWAWGWGACGIVRGQICAYFCVETWIVDCGRASFFRSTGVAALATSLYPQDIRRTVFVCPPAGGVSSLRRAIISYMY